MFTLVRIPPSKETTTDSASLIADYLAFDRQRTLRRQYMKAFGGMALLVLIGAVFGRARGDEALIAAALLLVVPVLLGVIEAWRWHRLNARLSDARVQAQTIRKS
jgi:hypothetical protein